MKISNKKLIIITCISLLTLILCVSPPDIDLEGSAYSIDIIYGDVYIAGDYYHDGDYYDNYNVAVYWKNGEIIELDGYKTNNIFVDGDDVYVVGEYTLPNGRYKKCYWKNGTRYDLDEEITSIYAHNGDIYTTGQYYNEIEDRNFACYWKNGIRVELKEGIIALGIYVEDNDVLVYGKRGWKNFYWINGQVYQVEDDVKVIKDVYIKDGSYYVTGLYEPEDINNFYYPCYWINGVRQSINMGEYGIIETIYGEVNLYEENEDIHLIARENEDIFYWKNTMFMKKFNHRYAKTAYYYDNVVYIVGYYYNDDDKPIPCYWKDNTRYDLNFQ